MDIKAYRIKEMCRLERKGKSLQMEYPKEAISLQRNLRLAKEKLLYRTDIMIMIRQEEDDRKSR